MDLLNGRFSLQMPEGSVNQARGHNVMAAPESNERETRLVYEKGEKKMVVMAWELFRKVGDNFDEEVNKAFKSWVDKDAVFKIKSAGEHARMALIEKPNEKGDAILYGVGCVRQKDGTLQLVKVYFNPNFHKESGACFALTEQVLASIQLGKRALMLEKGERSLPFLLDESRLSVQVPEGWTFSTTQGPDFLVNSLREVSVFGEPAQQVGIYVGGHPSYHHQKIDPEKVVKKTRKSLFLGKECEWFEFYEKGEEDWKSVELIYPLGEGGYWNMHVFSGGRNEESLQKVLKIAATLKIEANQDSE